MDSGRIFFGQPYRSNTFFFRNTSDDSIFRGTRSVLNMEEPSRKRSFFRSPEELYDEEYFDEQLPEKKRRLTPDQLQLLEKSFESENKLEPERKAQLAKELGLQPRQVAVWFQNRRARWKTKQLETDYDHLKSSYDSLVSDYDSILKQNDNLKSELLALTGKLQQKPTSSDPLQPPRVEDRISTGSDGSAVVDDRSPQLDLDSGDSYFPTHEYPGYTVNDVDDVFAVDQQEAIGWCIWS